MWCVCVAVCCCVLCRERLVCRTEATVRGYVKFWQRPGMRPSVRRTEPGDVRNLWADAGETLILVDARSCRLCEEEG